MGERVGRRFARPTARRRDRRPHIVILVVNLPPEKDRRVIREARAIEDAGGRVTVIGPRGPGAPKTLAGTKDTAIRSFPQPFAGAGILSFAAEFCWAFLAICVRLAGLMLRDRVDAVQACNPPDVFWPVALFMRATGRPFVFDHHDLCPELYECKTERPNPVALRVLRLCEWLSWRCASAVVATNESYRELAIARGGVPPDKVVVVRNGPAIAEVYPVDAAAPGRPGHPDVRASDDGASQRPAGEPLVPRQAWPERESPDDRQIIAYVGVINLQDNVEVAVLTAECLADLRGRDGWRMVIAGDGECLPALRALATERGLDDVVQFTGWLGPAEVHALLRSASVAIQPDQRSQMTELSTMAKTVEYVAHGVPVVSVDLREARRTAGEAARYVPTGTPDEFAKAIDQLLGDAPARAMMQAVARERFVTSLAWDHQSRSYIKLWSELLRRRGTRCSSLSPTMPSGEVAEPKH